MKRFTKTITLCALVALLVYACTGFEMEPMADESIESVETPQNAERHRPLRIRDARAWLEEAQPPVVLRGQQREARTRLAESTGRNVPDDREPVNMKLWRHAKRSQNEQFSVVEIPVYSTMQSFIMRPHSLPLDFTGQPGISRLVIRRNMSTGHVDAFVQTFTGDSMYIAQPNFRRNLFQNRYLTRDENFSGTEVISSVEGDFLQGFFVENGRRVRRFGEPVFGRASEQYERQSIQSTRSIQSFGRGRFICDYDEIWEYPSWDGDPGWCYDDWEEFGAGILLPGVGVTAPPQKVLVDVVPIYCDDDEEEDLCNYCWPWPCRCHSSGGGGGGGGNITNPPPPLPNPTPTADRIFRSPNASVRQIVNKIGRDCMGEELLRRIADNLGSDRLDIQFQPGWRSHYNPDTGMITLGMEASGSMALLHELLHVYQVQRHGTAWHNAAALNGEMEAWFAEYLFASRGNSDDTWAAQLMFYNTPFGQSVAVLGDLFDSRGNIRPGHSNIVREDIERRVYPAFRERHPYLSFHSGWLSNPQQMFPNIQQLSINC